MLILLISLALVRFRFVVNRRNLPYDFFRNFENNNNKITAYTSALPLRNRLEILSTQRDARYAYIIRWALAIVRNNLNISDRGDNNTPTQRCSRNNNGRGMQIERRYSSDSI